MQGTSDTLTITLGIAEQPGFYVRTSVVDALAAQCRLLTDSVMGRRPYLAELDRMPVKFLATDRATPDPARLGEAEARGASGAATNSPHRRWLRPSAQSVAAVARVAPTEDRFHAKASQEGYLQELLDEAMRLRLGVAENIPPAAPGNDKRTPSQSSARETAHGGRRAGKPNEEVTEEEVSVREAAKLLGESKDQVLARIKYGQLRHRDAASPTSSRALYRIVKADVLRIRTTYETATPPVPPRRKPQVRRPRSGGAKQHKHFKLEED